MEKKKKSRKHVVKPSAAETKAEILAKAKTAKADPARFKRASRYSLAATRDIRFEWQRGFSSIDGSQIRRLNKIGDTIVGTLGEVQNEVWMEGTYPLVLDDGTMVRIPANAILRKAVKIAEAVYQHVRITYLGKLYTSPGGHYKKVFTVELVPLGKDGVGVEGRPIIERAMAEAKRAQQKKGGKGDEK